MLYNYAIKQKQTESVKQIMANKMNIIKIAFYCMKLSFEASKGFTILRILVKALLALLPLAISLLNSKIIDVLTNRLTIRNNLVWVILIILYIVVVILQISLVNLDSYVMNVHSSLITNFVSIKLSQKVMTMDLASFDDPESYDKISNAQSSTQSIIILLWNYIDVLSSIVMFVSSFVVLVTFNWLLVIFFILVSLPNAVFTRFYTKKIYFWDKENVDKQRKYQYFYGIMTSKTTSMDIRFFDLKKYFIDKYKQSWNEWFEEKKIITQKRMSVQIITSTLPLLVMGISLIIIAKSIIEGENTVGDFVLYSSQMENLNSAIFALITSIVNVYDHKLRINNILDLFNISNTINNGTIKLKECIKSIEFKNVSFKYPGTEKFVLKNVSFSINKNEKIALVGVNGSGKTTILKLLLRFYDPQQGLIEINGIDIKKYTIKSLRNKFTAFFQSSPLYALRVEENIFISDIDSKCINKLNLALDKSGFRSVISSIPLGIKAHVLRIFDKEGIQLSIGQEQKMLLARTFYRDREVLLLDEPSSSLDPKGESHLFSVLSKENKTILFISHRLSNINVAQKIIVLDNGEIVEYGTHTNLMNKKGHYYELYNCQAKNFV